MIHIKFKTWVLYVGLKLVDVYLNYRIRFTNVIAVWNWLYKSICILFFHNVFLHDMLHINDCIDIWKCCNQVQFLKKKNSL